MPRLPERQPGRPAQDDPAGIVRMFSSGVAVSSSEQTFAVTYVVDGRDGTLVFPASRDFLACESPVLSVPDHRADGLIMLLALGEIADWRSDEACDRWLAMGGKPGHAQWARARVEVARYEGVVIDAERMATPNPLRAVEPALINQCNKDRERLAAAVASSMKMDVSEARIIGIDGWGADVRIGTAGIVRLRFDEIATTPEQAIRSMRLALGFHQLDPPEVA